MVETYTHSSIRLHGIVLKKPRRRGLILKNLKREGLHEKQAIGWELETHLRICLETEETQENLCPDGRSQDLPDAH
jgi:hypothetical protein